MSVLPIAVFLSAEPNPVDFGRLLRISAIGLSPNTNYFIAFIGGAAGNPVTNNNVLVRTDALGAVAWDFQIKGNVVGGIYVFGVFASMFVPLVGNIPGALLASSSVFVNGQALPPPPPVGPPPPNGPPVLPPPPPGPGEWPIIPIEYIVVGGVVVILAGIFLTRMR